MEKLTLCNNCEACTVMAQNERKIREGFVLEVWYEGKNYFIPTSGHYLKDFGNGKKQRVILSRQKLYVKDISFNEIY